MSVPMKVMMSAIIIDSGSSAKARSTVSAPAVNMFQSVSCRNALVRRELQQLDEGDDGDQEREQHRAHRHDGATSAFRPLRSKRQPKITLMAAPRSGKSGMSQRYLTCSTRDGTEVRASRVPCSTPASWSATRTSMVRNVWKMASTMARPTAASAAASTMTKRAKTWPRHAAGHEVGEGDEVDVRAVQDELDAHEHADRVAAGGHGEEARG